MNQTISIMLGVIIAIGAILYVGTFGLALTDNSIRNAIEGYESTLLYIGASLLFLGSFLFGLSMKADVVSVNDGLNHD